MSSHPEQTIPASVVGETTPTQSVQQTTGPMRLFFLDHLRAALTVLVVLHHLAVIYGAAAVFYYVEAPGSHDQLAQVLLSAFVLINQAYFMGFFFLISGYFTPGSFERKGAGTFYKDRLLRLGIPLLVYVFVLSPLAALSPIVLLDLYQTPTIPAHLASFPYLPSPISWQLILSVFGVGPLWFAEMLLLFCLGYVIWRRVVRARVQPDGQTFNPPGYRAVGLFILGLALVSYLVRIVVPLGVEIPIFGFPTFAYFPQYLSFFILGSMAFRRNWFQTIPGSMGKTGFVVALGATLVLAAPALSGGAAFLGSGSWQSAVYALWDSIFSVGMCLALLTFFRHFLNRKSRFGSFLSQQAFTVYIIHIPIIVLLALALRGIHLEAFLKLALVALIAVPLCFALAFLIRKLPLASRIL